MKNIPVYRIRPSEVESFADCLDGLGILFSIVRTRAENKILIFRASGMLREIFQITTEGGQV